MPPTATSAPSRATGLILAIGGVLALSPDALLVRLITADPWTLIWWRGLLVAATLSPFLFRHRRNGFRFDRGVWLAALFYGIGTVCFVQSLGRTFAANTLVILSATPLVAALLDRLFLNERLRRETAVAIFAVSLGVTGIFIDSLGGGRALGDLLALATAAAMAANLTALRGASHDGALPALALGSLLATILATPFAAPLPLGKADFALLALLGAVVLPVAFGCIFQAPRYLPASEVALIMLLEAPLGPLWVWLAIGEAPTAQVILAGAVIVVAVAMHAGATLWWNGCGPSGRRARIPGKTPREDIRNLR